jgi:hypothetical protein
LSKSDDRQVRLRRLLEKGVDIPVPEMVAVAPEVLIERISGRQVTLGPGTRLAGSDTLILEGAHIGSEGPVTLENCLVGPRVVLGNGYFCESVFLEGVKVGSGAHLRAVCILEEKASIAHTVGLKQTILFPYVTLGSLINFCDCLMAGGTSPGNHSEVGSAFIHFNFTPNQDKATPSMMGNVPQGVMLDQPPIFLGGQGGLVGPCQLAFGTVTAAGSICRKDVTRSGLLVMEGGHRRMSMPFTSGGYRQIRRSVGHNIAYIANLIALRHWYHFVRSRFLESGRPHWLWLGLMDRLGRVVTERVNRLEGLRDKMPASVASLESENKPDANRQLIGQQRQFHDHWPEVRAALSDPSTEMGDHRSRDSFLGALETAVGDHGTDYLAVVRSLPPPARDAGTAWLASIVAAVGKSALAPLPLIHPARTAE